MKNASKNADIIATDTWVSMGDEAQKAQRLKDFKGFTVNNEIMKQANDSAIFLHCLPAFHNRETKIGEEIYQKYGLNGMEVADEVFESKHSIVFDQAENRLHTIKAVMVATLGR